MRRGFSLIEALVALIIAAMALAGILELQRQLADGQARDQRALELAGLERNAMALTADLNPTATPQGSSAAGRRPQLRLDLDPARAGAAQHRLARRPAGAFELRLYRVTVRVLDRGGQPLGQFAFDRVGWRKLERPAPYLAPAPPPTPLPPPPPSGPPSVGL